MYTTQDPETTFLGTRPDGGWTLLGAGLMAFNWLSGTIIKKQNCSTKDILQCQSHSAMQPFTVPYVWHHDKCTLLTGAGHPSPLLAQWVSKCEQGRHDSPVADSISLLQQWWADLHLHPLRYLPRDSIRTAIQPFFFSIKNPRHLPVFFFLFF